MYSAPRVATSSWSETAPTTVAGLALADVGCAVGSGTEAALAMSDVCLLGSDLQGVPAAVGIARSTQTTIRQNFGWAMGYKPRRPAAGGSGLLSDPLVAPARWACRVSLWY